jgi:outer membrane protein assembly factor BamB
MAACVLAASVASAQTQSPPPQAPTPTPQPSPAPTPTPTPLAIGWQIPLAASDDQNAVPWIVPGEAHVFVTGAGSALTAHSVTDGVLQWSSHVASAVAPLVVGDRVTVVSAHAVYVLDQRTGQEAWRAEFDGAPVAAFASSARLGVFFKDRVETWDASGKPAWHAAIAGTVITPVAATGGLLVFGTDEPALAAVDEATGAVKWKVALPAAPTSLRVAADRAYFGCEDGALYSYRLTGEVKQAWRSARIRSIGQPAVDDRSAYFALLDNSVRAFDAEGGTQQWDQVLETRPVAGPFRVGPNVAVALGNGHVVELSTRDGKPLAPSSTSAATRVRLIGVAVSADAARIYTVTIAGDQSRTLAMWSRAVAPGHP